MSTKFNNLMWFVIYLRCIVEQDIVSRLEGVELEYLVGGKLVSPVRLAWLLSKGEASFL